MQKGVSEAQTQSVNYIKNNVVPGPSYKGAGSGGRIAVHLTQPFIFGGILTALGGTSSSRSSYHGSPGTVFVKVTIGKEPFRMIQVDNNNRNTLLSVTLAESKTTMYVFETIHLVRNGALNIKEVLKSKYWKYDY